MENVGSDINREKFNGIFVIAVLVGLNTCQDADMVQGFLNTDEEIIDDDILLLQRVNIIIV